jgi:hypothetical protein
VQWYRSHDRLHTGDAVTIAHDALAGYTADVAVGKDTLLVCDTSPTTCTSRIVAAATPSPTSCAPSSPEVPLLRPPTMSPRPPSPNSSPRRVAELLIHRRAYAVQTHRIAHRNWAAQSRQRAQPTANNRSISTP